MSQHAYLNSKTLAQMKIVYQELKKHSTPRNGLWLESQGYDIEVLHGYQEEVMFFDHGIPMAALTLRLKISYSRLLDIMSGMRACGFIHTIKKGVHLLLEEPSEEAFVAAKRRREIPLTYSRKKDGVRGYLEDQMIGIHARLDEHSIQIAQIRKHLGMDE